MKKLLLFSILFFITAIYTLYSEEYNVSSLYVTMYDDEIFSASLDGNDFGKSSNEAEIDGIPEGKYFLKVVKDNGARNSKSNVIFSDYVFIPAGYRLFAVIDDRGNFNIYKKANYDSYFVNHNNQPQKDFCNCNCEVCKNCNYKIHKPEMELGSECKYNSMKDRDLNDLISTIKKLSFESSQIEVAKQALDKNILTTAQVKEIIKIFAFDESKIEIAKYAYKNVCDKNNYFNIYDSFAFESSILEVKNYIEGK